MAPTNNPSAAIATSESRAVALTGRRRPEYELAFLPAALEITERPPSPIGRAIAGIIMAIFCAGAIWSMLGTVDVVVTARGKIIPSGGSKLVQPLDSGVVRAILVHDGQRVHAGETLIDLDPTMTDAELEHFKTDLLAARLDVARLRAALANNEDPLSAFEPPSDATPAQVEMHRAFLSSQAVDQNSKLAEIDRQISQKQAERSTVAAQIGKLQATIPLLQERYDIHKTLLDKALVSKLTFLTEAQELVGEQQDLTIQQSKLKEAEEAISALQQSRERATTEYRHSLYDQLVKSEQKAAEAAQDVIRSERRTKLQELTAPVDGVVQQLAVHTVGGIVTPAQVLAVVVPLGSRLEIEASLSNDDVGFVNAGQEAAIKVDAFNFSRYGLLHGHVLGISPDAIARDARDGGQPSPGHSVGAPESGDPFYAVRVSLDQQQFQVGERKLELGPGMAVSVEVKTGSRRIISYLLSPFTEYRHDALRER